MSKSQLLVIVLSSFVFLGLYFGGSLKPKEIKSAEKVRAVEVESTDINALLMAAKPNLSARQEADLMALESKLNDSKTDLEKIETYKELASTWYSFNNSTLSAYYAEQVAELENTEDAWSIAGTTYVIALQSSKEVKIKKFTSKRAIKAFENAISLNPENIQHQVNLAVVYKEFPPENNPMMGVLMLLDLNKKHPENTGVLLTIAQFGIETNQLDKAKGRIETALKLEPENPRANCLMAKVLEKKGNFADSQVFKEKCLKLRK